MKKLTFIYLAVVFPYLFFAPKAIDVTIDKINTSDKLVLNAQSNDFNIIIDGQIVNKLGETGASTENLLVQYIRNNQVKGEAYTSSTGSFSISGVVTGISELYVPKNKIVLTGSTIFDNTTTIEIELSEPGRLVVTDIKGATIDFFVLRDVGKYIFTYDGKSSSGVHLITLQSSLWSKGIKVVSMGNNGTDGLKLQSFNPFKYGYSLKSAEKDTLKISGSNISTTYIDFWHERSDINVGQKHVNQGVEIFQSPVIQNVVTGQEVSIDLNDYVYNDDQSTFLSRDTSFKMAGSTVSFSSDTTGTFVTVVDVTDGEDPTLTNEIEIQVIVDEAEDIIPPVFLLQDTMKGMEDNPITFTLNENATDNKTSSENINWNIGNGSFTGTIIDGRIATFTPVENYNGADVVTVAISDESGNIASKELIIVYESVPDAPVANNDTDETGFNTTKTTLVLINDTDIENDIIPNLTSVVVQPTNGTTSVNEDGSIDYTPNEGYEGVDVYDYEITDSTGLKDTARVTITTNANPNFAPVLSQIPNDTIDEDTPKTGTSLDDFVTDDSTSDENIVWEASSGDESKLTVTINADRQPVFIPTKDQNGTVDVTYIATDEGGLNSSITQQITILPVNDIPVLGNIADVSFNEDESFVGSAITGSDVENSPSQLTLSALSNNTNIQVALDENWIPAYSATTNYNGSGQITFTLTDTNGASDERNINVVVNSVDDSPIAVDDSATTQYNIKTTIAVYTNDTDVDGDLNTQSTFATSNPGNGSIVHNTDGSFDYTPNDRFSGADSFKYKIKDANNNKSNEATVFITVESQDNNAPTANNDTYSINEEETVNLNILNNDMDAEDNMDKSSVSIKTQPLHGTINSINAATGEANYTPAINYYGIDSIKYTVSDSEGLESNIATVYITILNVNDDEQIIGMNPTLSIEEDNEYVEDLTQYESDPDPDDVLSWVATSNNSDINISLIGKTATITSTENYNGSAEISYTLSDANGADLTQVRAVTITPVDDAPIFMGTVGDKTSPEDIPNVFNESSKFEEVDGEQLSYNIKGLPTGWSQDWNANQVEVNSPKDYYGTINGLTIEASDPQGNKVESNNFSIIRTPVNDPVERTGDITNILLLTEQSTIINLNTKFQDKETADIDLNYELIGFDLGTSSITDGIITITAGTVPGTDTGLRVKASDESTSIYSNYFTVTINQRPNNVPNIATIPNDNGNEDVAKTGVGLDDYVSDDHTSDANIIWSINTGNPSILEATIDAQHRIQYTPQADQNGNVTVTVTATDEGGLSSQKSFTYTINPVDDAPRFSETIGNKTSNEDINNIFDEGSKFTEVDGEELTYTIQNLPEGWSQAWTGSQVTVSSPADYNGTITGITIQAEDPQNNTVESNPFSITRIPVNDAVYSTGTIPDLTVVLNQSTTVDLKPFFEDVETTDLSLFYTLSGLSLGTYTITNGVLTITATTAGTESDLIANASDGETNVNSNFFSLTVNDLPNEKPVANDDDANTDEDVAITINVLANDTDDKGLKPSSVKVIVSPAHGSTSVNTSNGNIAYTPASDNNNNVLFKYEVADNDGAKDTATVTVTINPIDDSPRFNGVVVNKTSLEDISNIFNEGSKFTEPDGETLSCQLIGLPTGWTQNWNTSQVTVNSPLNYNGTITGIIIRAEDPQNNTVESNPFSITRTPVNDAVYTTGDINDIVLTIGQSTQIDLKPIFEDIETTDANLQYLLNGLSLGTYTITNGILTITATTVGLETDLRANASDGETNVNSNYFSLTVKDIPNEKPVAVNDNVNTNEDASIVIYVLANDTDDNGLNPASVKVIEAPAHGTTSISDGEITYTPATNNNNDVTFEYEVADYDGAKDTATVGVTVNSVDDAPVFSGTIGNKTSDEDVNNIFVVTNFTEVDGESLGYTIKNLPAGWSQVWNGNQVMVSSPDDYNGTISNLTIEANDPQNNKTLSNAFSITRTPVNDAVYTTGDISDIVLTIGENTSIDLKPKFEDKETSDANLVYILNGLSLGTYIITNGVAIITATTVGTESDLIANASDGETNVNSNFFSLTVNDVPNEKPVANDDVASTDEDVAKTIDVLSNDTDDKGLNTASVTVIVSPAHGSTSVLNGQITYTPATNNNDDVTFKYEVADNEGLKDTATVSVTVNPVDDIPVFNGTVSNKTSDEDVDNVFDEGGKFFEPDGEVLTYQLIGLPAGWTQSWNTSQVTVSSPADYNGTITGISIQAKDPQNNSVESNTFTITRDPVNDNVYTTGDISDIVLDKGESTTIDLKAHFEDKETADIDLIYILDGLSLGTYSIDNGIITLTATTVGTETDLKAQASDGETYASSNFFTLTVNETAQLCTVTFDFKNAGTDTRLTTGSATLYYRLLGGNGWTQDSIKITSTGIITLHMIEGRTYEIEVEHSLQPELATYSAFALIRDGDLEAFDQQDANDKHQEFTVRVGGDYINIHILLDVEMLIDWSIYGMNCEGMYYQCGNRKVCPDDRNITIWWNMNHAPPNEEHREWVQDVLAQLDTIPHLYLNTTYIESTERPSGVVIEIDYWDNLGNATSMDLNNCIIGGGSLLPISSPPSQRVFKVELWQALTNWQDSGGAPPFFTYAPHRALNELGIKVVAVTYLFRAGTEF